MQFSFDQFESVLYRSDFQEPRSRLDACLSVHAVLTGQEDVPRYYLPDVTHSSQALHCALKTCLLQTPREARARTGDYLRLLGFRHNQLTCCNPDEVFALAKGVESVLTDGWGYGTVHYEQSRFAPQAFCGLLDWIETHIEYADDWANHVVLTLRKRFEEMRRWRAEQDYCLTMTERSHPASIFSQVYATRSDEEWRALWMSPQRYLSRGLEELIVDGLVVSHA